MAITKKQKRFCEEFLIDLNATKAAIRAGYSEKTARVIAAQNLSKLNIQKYLGELIAKRSERTQVNSDKVIKETAKIGFSNIKDAFDDKGELKSMVDIDFETAAAIESYRVKRKVVNGVVHESKVIRMHPKVHALDNLARHTGAFAKDNEGKGAKVIIVELGQGQNPEEEKANSHETDSENRKV